MNFLRRIKLYHDMFPTENVVRDIDNSFTKTWKILEFMDSYC